MAKSGGLRVPVKLEAAGDSHIGGRTHNEDAILIRPDLNLYLVADGAGGQNAGNVAASLATTTVAHFFEQTKDAAELLPEYDALGLPTSARRLSAAVQEANREILEISKTSDRHHGMGTTVVAALFDLEHRVVHIAYVGDSRCYRLREGRLEQLTHDHSLINDVLELRPNISDERVKRLPQNVITRALGMMDNLRVSMRTHSLIHGDRYLLCSDGLSDHVSDAQLSESLALDISCDDQVALLMSMALEAGADDNVACVIIDCALPQAAMKAGSRPLKKMQKRSSRPQMPRMDGVTEESVPEIVLYDRPERHDSSPLIHVVPADSSSPEVVEAVQTVLNDDDPITKSYHSPPNATISYRADHPGDPTGGEPAVVRGKTEKPPKPAFQRPAIARTQPTPKAESDGTERGGAAAITQPEKKISAPRLQKVDAGDKAAPSRSGDTRQPPMTPTLPDSERPREMTPAAPITERKRSNLLRPAKRPHVPLPEHRRNTLNGPLPSATTTPSRPLPPLREPFDTSDFTNDSVPCHACGSIIMRTSDLCMYCGAPTGFVIKDK